MGRGEQLGALDSFLGTARDRFAVLAIEGEAGIGKTTIWREGVRLARERGATVLLARATESETGLSFTGLADLFNPLGDQLMEALPLPQREALSTVLLKVPAPDRGVDERALSASVLSVLRLVSDKSHVIVAVDDAQWLDSPSARALAFAVRRLDTEPLGLLVTARTSGGQSHSFDRAIDPSRRKSLRLGPLSVAVLHELIKRQIGHAFSRPVMVRIAEASGGNPFYALEIAAELSRRSPAQGGLPVPASLAKLLETRIAGLPEQTRDALLVSALLSRPIPGLVDVTALEAGERAGIVAIEPGRIRFCHPLLAAAVSDRTGPSERRRVHRQLAQIVTDPVEKAVHRALGSVTPDESIARELDNAAALAGIRGAPEAAADLVELALGLTPPGNDQARKRRLVSAARFWFDAGDLARSQETIQTALAETPTGDVRAEALQMLGQLHARRSSFARAFTAAIEALESAPGDPALRGGIELDIIYYLVSLGDFPGAERHAQAAVDATESIGETGALADALAVLTMAEFLGGSGYNAYRMARALELEEPTRRRTWQMRPSFLHGLLLLWTGCLDEAVSVLDDMHTQTIEHGEESSVPFVCFYLMWAHLWRGDLGRAGGLADEARDAAALLGDPASTGIALAAGALVHAHDGSISLACEEARNAIGCFGELEWPAGTIWPLWALGLAKLSSGDPSGVDTALGPLADMLPTMGAGDPILGVFLPDEIEALIELGRLDRAELLLDWFEGRGAELDRIWSLAAAGRCRALLCAAHGDLEHALEAAAQSLAAHDRITMPFERARTLLVKGRLLRRTGKRALAKQALDEAAAVFDRIGASVWYERVEAELARLGSKRAPRDQLTPTELLVAGLAASGVSNREIAERAFLTVKAVEANLTRVYRKLGIRSRAGLARALQAVGEFTPK